MAYGYGLSASLFQSRARTPCSRTTAELMWGDDDAAAPTVRPRCQPAGVRVPTPRTARAVREMLHMVTQPGGTALKAQPMGCTPSAARPAPRTSRRARVTRTRSTAPGSSAPAPALDPRIVVAVMVDEPTTESTIAAKTLPRRCSPMSRSRRCGHAGGAARHGRAAGDCRRHRASEVESSSMAAPAQPPTVEAAVAWPRPVAHARSRRTAARCARATPSSPRPAPRTTHAASSRPRSPPVRRPAWSRPTTWRCRACPRRTRGVAERPARARRPAPRAPSSGHPSRAPRRARRDRHQRQDLDDLVARRGAVATRPACGVVGKSAPAEPPVLASTGLTTPDAVALQTAFRRFADEGLAACAIRLVRLHRRRRAAPGRHGDQGRDLHQLHARPSRPPRDDGRLLVG